jgi:hypothetical protein
MSGIAETARKADIRNATVSTMFLKIILASQKTTAKHVGRKSLPTRGKQLLQIPGGAAKLLTNLADR